MDSNTYEAGAHSIPSNESLRPKSQKFQITKELLDSFLYGSRIAEPVNLGKRISDRKRKLDNSENENWRKIQSLWCKECCKYIQGECPIHGSFTSGNDLKLTYAVRSFPPEVQLCISSIPGCKYGACAGKSIPRGTWIGPYEGKLVYSTKLPDNTDNTYVWEIYENGHFSHFVDGSDEAFSSWMRFIRCARNTNEQNMTAFQYRQNIYYRALRDIPAGDEILVWYGQTYLQFCGIPLTLNEEIKVREKGTDKDLPVVAHHPSLPDSRRLQIPQPKLPPSPNSPIFSPSRRSTSLPLLTSPTTVPPYCQARSPFRLQRPSQISPQYHVSQPFQVPQQFQVSSSSPVPGPCQMTPSSQVPPVSNLPRTSRLPSITQVRSTAQAVPPSQLPLLSFVSSSTRISPGSQMPSSPQSTPNQSGILTPKTFYSPAAGHKERGPVAIGTSMTPLPTHESCAVDVKENMPVRSSTNKAEMQQKTAINVHALKPSRLQNVSPQQNTALSMPQENGLNHVSSTVDTNEDGSWKCGQCGNSFSQRLILQMHVCSKSPKKPFQCGHCSLAFANPSDLRDHVVTHTSDRPFKCGFCGRSFAGATTLNNHMRTHTGEKPFACETCGRTFAIATQLKRHMKIPGECQTSEKDTQLYNQNGEITVEQ